MRKNRIPYIPYRSLLLSTIVLNDITLILAVDSHAVHFQTTTRNKRTYEQYAL